MTTVEMIGISGTGCYFPRKKARIRDLAENHGLNYKRIVAEHNVKSIHIARPSENEYIMAEKAAKNALKNANLNPGDIDVIIFCKGMSAVRPVISYSSQLISSFKGSRVYGFDLEAGFIGGMMGMQIAKDLVTNDHELNNALIVASQKFETHQMYKNERSRFYGNVFGDGAAAIVMSKNWINNHILTSTFMTDHYTSFLENITNQKPEQPMKRIFHKKIPLRAINTSRYNRAFSQLVQQSVKNSYKTIDTCLKAVNLNFKDIDHFIKTQWSLKETEFIVQKLKLDNIPVYNASSEKGHLGPADMLSNLHLMLIEAPLRNLDITLLASSNYDCSSGAMVLRR